MKHLWHIPLYVMIEKFIEKNGYAPSYTEIGIEVGLAKSNVQYHLVAMKKAGLIDFVTGKTRTITLKGE